MSFTVMVVITEIYVTMNGPVGFASITESRTCFPNTVRTA
jgi:hypothetical protein